MVEAHSHYCFGKMLSIKYCGIFVTDSVICHNRPYIVLMRKTSNEVFMPYLENHVSLKRLLKNSQKVCRIEVSRMWKTKNVFAIRIIIVALGSVSVDLSSCRSHSICQSTRLQCFKELNIINFEVVLANLNCSLCILCSWIELGFFTSIDAHFWHECFTEILINNYM